MGIPIWESWIGDRNHDVCDVWCCRRGISRISSLSLPSAAPIGALLAVGVVLMGIASGTYPGVIAAEVFGSIAAPQFAFVAVSLTDHLIRSFRLIPQVQAAIGRQLRAELEAPRSLPPELDALVTQLVHV